MACGCAKRREKLSAMMAGMRQRIIQALKLKRKARPKRKGKA